MTELNELALGISVAKLCQNMLLLNGQFEAGMYFARCTVCLWFFL